MRLFEPECSRVFGLPPGADFPAELVRGILERTEGWPPEAVARIRILVNTRRMQRRLKRLFVDGRARLVPRIDLVTEPRALAPTLPLPSTVPPLRRQLELLRLLEPLLMAGMAPRTAAVDMAQSLAALMDELQGEGIEPEALTTLDLKDMSGHWQNSTRFLALIRDYIAVTEDIGRDPEAVRRLAFQAIIGGWQNAAPDTPVLVAGSTGSRATTRMLMTAVARLPQGALILPGFDDTLPTDLWQDIRTEDHAQFRYAALMRALDLPPAHVQPWVRTPASQRNSLISLSLRPAPVTSQWINEGPTLGDLREATRGMTLITAPRPREETLAIAVAMRQAVEQGKTVALISPDRTLTRRVTAALSRWDIEPDDSAGQPLNLSPPGRLMRMVLGMIGTPVEPAALIALLSHPLTHTGGQGRHEHGLWVVRLEGMLRGAGLVSVTERDLDGFATEGAFPADWVAWLKAVCAAMDARPPRAFDAILAHVIEVTERVAAGPAGDGAGKLWEAGPGRALSDVLETTRRAASSQHVDFSDARRIVETTLQAGSARNDTARTDVMIWGTLEARVQGADVVILGGLNEETWPERPNPDPWLNRDLRHQLGLPSPDREVGLSAHDYQQAVCAGEVILSRATRDDDTETVASRWLSRLTNLLSGLPAQHGPAALEIMSAKGDLLLRSADALEVPRTDPAPAQRPSPAPPVGMRPTSYSVTEIQRLIRDPYAVYARRVLNLAEAKPLTPAPDARLRGDVFHKIMDRVFAPGREVADVETGVRDLIEAGEAIIKDTVPWRAIAEYWLGHLRVIAPRVISDELVRQATGRILKREVAGAFTLAGTPFRLKGKADRIDRLHDGRTVIYDYKTGNPPTGPEIAHFDMQLPLEAVIAEHGGFKDIPPGRVAHVCHIGLGRSGKSQITELTHTKQRDLRTEKVAAKLAELLLQRADPATGYSARRAVKRESFEGVYDHLARFGEWDESQNPEVVHLK